MAFSGEDGDVGSNTEDDGSHGRQERELSQGTESSGEEEELQEERSREGASDATNPGRPLQTQSSEKTVTRTELSCDNIRGVDDLSSAVNSLDDHVQAGLQEIRNCIANLQREKTKLHECVKSLSGEVVHVSAERAKYQQAVTDLQQEVTALRDQLSSQQRSNGCLREQLSNHQRDNAVLEKHIQEMREEDERHLSNIAKRRRSQRLAHSAIVRWRRKVLDKNRGVADLVEENNQLRAELLLCQEAAKKAFLRSANVLNSEAITLFQDAATRRLGLEEDFDQNDGSQSSSSSSSPEVNPEHSSQEEKEDHEEGVADKDNRERYKDKSSSREKSSKTSDKISGGDFSRKPRHTRDTSRQDNHRHEREYSMPGSHSSLGDYSQQFDRELGGSFGSYHSRHHTGMLTHQGSHHCGERSLSSSFGAGFSEGRLDPGTIPKKKHAISDFAPDSLRREARAFLEQLHGDKRGKLDPAAGASFDSQQSAQRTLASHQDVSHTKTCHCKRTKTPATYKCLYCTPIQNSSFGHAKDRSKKPVSSKSQDTSKGTSNVARNAILTSMNTDKRKVLYTPSASTVVIEKHITK